MPCWLLSKANLLVCLSLVNLSAKHISLSARFSSTCRLNIYPRLLVDFLKSLTFSPSHPFTFFHFLTFSLKLQFLPLYALAPAEHADTDVDVLEHVAAQEYGYLVVVPAVEEFLL